MKVVTPRVKLYSEQSLHGCHGCGLVHQDPTLGGPLGSGGMGVVCLAHQVLTLGGCLCTGRVLY